MELYQFLRGSLAWTATIAVLWPINVPLAALAYKVRQGPLSIDMSRKEFWVRSTFAALVMALLTVGVVVVDYLLAEEIGFPAGPVHLVIWMGYIPAGMWVFFVFFALEDLTQGLGVLVIYICLPGLVLFLLNQVVPFWQPLVDWAEGPLKAPT